MGNVIFFSHCIEDTNIYSIPEIAQMLREKEGISEVIYCEKDCWDNIVKFMDDSLARTNILVVFCSPKSLESKWVKKEWGAAMMKNIPIIPIFADKSHIPPILAAEKGIQFRDFSNEAIVSELYELIIKKIEVQHKQIPITDPITDSKNNYLKPQISDQNLVKKNLFKIEELLEALAFNEALQLSEETLSIAESKSLDITIILETLKKVKKLKKEDEERDYQGQKLVKAEYLVIREIENGKELKTEDGRLLNKEILIQNMHVIELNIKRTITSLPVNFGDLKFLKKIVLRDCKLSSIPESFGNLESLIYIDFGINKLSRLPESFGNLPALNYLDLGWNKFINFPETLCSLKSLIHLDINLNNIPSLPESINQLQSLEYLDLSNSKLTSLPESIDKLQSLKRLDLSTNKLSTISDSIKTWLQGLHEKGCQIFTEQGLGFKTIWTPEIKK